MQSLLSSLVRLKHFISEGVRTFRKQRTQVWLRFGMKVFVSACKEIILEHRL